MLSHCAEYLSDECGYAEYHILSAMCPKSCLVNADCKYAGVIVLSIVMLSSVILSVIMMNVFYVECRYTKEILIYTERKTYRALHKLANLTWV
jgi:hypothetical protein